jgi:hypothetical protein
MPRRRKKVDDRFVHALEVKLKGFPKPFFFTIASGDVDRLRHRVRNDTGGFFWFRNEADGLYSASLGNRAVVINHKFTQYVQFLFDPSDSARADKPEVVELPDARLWFEGESEPHGFESDSEPHEGVDGDYGDLEGICTDLDAHGGDPEIVTFGFNDVNGEYVVFRVDNLVMIDVDAKLVDRELYDEWHKAMDVLEAADEAGATEH